MLLRNYGISGRQYDEMFARQRGECALCGSPPKANKRLHVDHCHSTGRVRGLLCIPCNLALGKLGDSIVSIKRALRYLEGKSV